MMLYLVATIILYLHFAHGDGLNPMSAPVAGETIVAEKPYTIRWEPGTPGPVRIELHWGDSSLVTIVDETDNSGSYEWTPSSLYAGKDNFFMDICDNLIDNECTYTFDGRFAIVADTSDLTSSSPTPSSTSILSSSSSTSSPSLTTTPSSSTLTSSLPSTTVSATGPSSTPAAKPGLSSGAKAGIGVSVAVVGAGALALGALFWTRKQNRQHPSQVQEMGAGEKTVYARNELPGEQQNIERAELEGTPGNTGSQMNNHQASPNGVLNDLPEWRR